MRNFILYWLDTYATFTRFTTCGQGATPRCDTCCYALPPPGWRIFSFSLSLCEFMCLCVYVFMQFMGQGATFTDYVQIRICEIAARASPAEQCVQCVQCVALGMMKPNRRRNRDQTTHTSQ